MRPPSIVAAFGLAFVALAAAGLLMKLFRPARPAAADRDDPWAQHNELRTPSLEQSAQAGRTEVDAAVLSQIIGD